MNLRDVDFVAFLQRKAFEYFEIYHSEVTGLIADVALPGSPSSIAATGFGVSCYPVAVEREWWSRSEAAQRTLTLLRFLSESSQEGNNDASGYRGFYYHFLDMRTGRRAWGSEVSTIDTTFLFCGLLTAAAYFNTSNPVEREIRELTLSLYKRIEWDWALNGGNTLSMGWRPEGGFIPYRWQGYDEALPLYLLAIGSDTHPVGPASYSAWGSTFSWTSPADAPLLHAGPLFIHLFAQGWLDLKNVRDPLTSARNTDYFRNTQRAIAQQIDYAERNPRRRPGYSRSIWGLTASDGARRKARVNGRMVDFLGYVARGVPYGPDDGTVAPWAPIACLPFLPAESTHSLAYLLKNYPDLLIDGRFPEAFNPALHRRKGSDRWQSDRVVGIDQGLVVMMVENFRTGLIWSLTKKIAPFRQGMERVGMSGGWLSATAECQTDASPIDTHMYQSKQKVAACIHARVP